MTAKKKDPTDAQGTADETPQPDQPNEPTGSGASDSGVRDDEGAKDENLEKVTRAIEARERKANEIGKASKRLLPTVGRMVHYWDRDELVGASDSKRDPEPYAATVAAVHRGADGFYTDVCTLIVHHPEYTAALKREVRFSETPEANTWSWPRY